ncbi:MAG TPA: ATP-binding protein, partial [Solirubrobacteraceae bacterium]|nr:ATP-binding protein [Solirubrobacteraceae bacterium]
GVPAIDSTVANHLVQTVDASRLMGASVIITGLSSEIAQTLVTLGVDLSKVNAVGDLQGGIEEAERIAIESDADVVTARQRARALAVGLDMPSTDQTLLATAISEIARNITTYADGGRGEVLIGLVRDARGRRGVRVIARDDGPGIDDLERALTDGYTTGGGLGLGLPGARRLVDEFDIQTAPGQGTTVTLVKWTRSV